ncbi:MAG: alcohol dehydrogenase catalytic domain-containing protein [bacterium]
MRAALYEAVRTVRLVDRPIPKAGPGEAVVRIALCGICGTDLHIYFNGMLPPGIVLGHENVGTVAEVGAGVEGIAVGDRVAAGPPGSCSRCYHCLHGRPTLCVDGFEQTNGLRRDGGMAEYMLVKDAEQSLYPLPDNLSFEDAVLFDSVATAYRGLTHSAFKMGDNVVVSGAGPIGLAAVQHLRLGGARHITVLEIVEEKRKLAQRSGADLTLDPLAEGPALTDRIFDLYDGVGADLAVECAGVPQSFELCLNLVRACGQMLHLGAGGEEVAVLPWLLTRRELDIKSTLAFAAEEARKCLDLIASGRFVTEGMLSDVVPLAEVVEKGFDRLAADKALVKVAVAP